MFQWLGIYFDRIRVTFFVLSLLAGSPINFLSACCLPRSNNSLIFYTKAEALITENNDSLGFGTFQDRRLGGGALTAC
jgi:hypothetical protein